MYKHLDWLNLIEQNGLVFSEPVLSQEFSNGFEYPKPYILKQIKTNFEKFDLDDKKSASREFVDFIFEKILGYELYKEHSIPDYSKCYLDEFMQELKPHRVVESGERRLHIYITDKAQNLKRNENIEGKWKASPLAKIQRLLAETNHHFGLVTNGYEFILLYRPEEGGFSYIGFDMSFMLQEPQILAAFLGILNPKNFANILELAKKSYENQLEITDKLGEQVRNAVERFVWALDKYDEISKNELLKNYSNEEIYEMAIAAIIRMIFLLYAEERELLPFGELFYDNSYSLHTLIKDLALEKQETPELFKQNKDAWQRVLALFNLLYFGSNHPDLQIPAYSGELFEPLKYEPLYDARFEITNEELYEIIKLLTQREENQISKAISYKIIGVEHIGYIYEGLLDYKIQRSSDVLVKPLPKSNEVAIPLKEIENLSANQFAKIVKDKTGKKPTAAQLRKINNPNEEDIEYLKSHFNEELADKLLPFASLIQLDEVVFPNRLYLTQSQNRHSSGAHYTPQIITETIVEKTLKPLVYEGDTLKSPKEILNLKIADIAMGSGAFLVQVIRYLAEKLVESWQIIQSNTDKPITIPFGQESQGLDNELLLPTEYQDQITMAKRFIARECIYGVDINHLAVEVAKLSIWLETLAKDLPFTFIDHALVEGNSLFGYSSNDMIKKTNSLLLQSAKDELQKILEKREKIKNLPDLEVNDKRRKSKLLQEINQLIEKVKKDFDYQFEPYIKDIGSKPFHWPLYFPEVFAQNGFDAVVGNPPYVRQELIKEYKDYFSNYYACYTGTADLYVYFFERAYELLKENGRLGFITSNKYFRAKYGEKLREFLIKNTKIDNVIDLNGVRVFASATVDSAIITFTKTKENQNNKIKVYEGDFEKYFEFSQSNLTKDSFIFIDEKELKLKEKIERIGTPLKDWDIQINYGIKTGFNEAFIIDTAKRDELIAKDPKSDEIIKPLLRGRDIKRYSYEWAGLWIIATFPAKNINIDDYPAIKEYLQSFGKRLEQSGEKGCRKKTGNKWFETQDQIAYWKEFEKEKIIYPNMTKFLPFYFDTKKFYTNQKCYIITGENLKYLTAILNSKIFTNYLANIFPTLQGGTKELSKVFFEKLPIPKIPKEKQKPFEELVDKIIEAKEKGLDSSEYERKIDEMVYRLYELTDEEIEIVEKGKDG